MINSSLKRGQVAIEFVSFVAIAFMIMAVFMIFVRENLQEATADQNYEKVKDVAITVKGEIFLASSVKDGYQRSFDVPQTVDYANYSIIILNQNSKYHLWVSTNNSEYIADIPSVSGTITKGTNIIRKDGGTVFLNS